ncbi:MAG: thioredoxin domain-containing protein, partial [Pseudomonadota bacterium]
MTNWMHKLAAASLFATLVACSGATESAGAGGATSADGAQTAQASAGAGGATSQDAPDPRPTDQVLGAETAPVTLIEYASVTCGGCARAHETIIPDLKSQYVDTGKVRFVFREYPKAPASLVNQSFLGSIIARCAAEKGGNDAFFLVIDALLKNQRTWIFGDTEAELTKIASQAGMDKEAFDACLTRQDLLDVINA